MKKFVLLTGFLFISLSIFGEDKLLKYQYPRQNGSEVELLQRFLLYKGYSIGVEGVDAWLGPNTTKALITYQKSKNLDKPEQIYYSSIKDFDFMWKPTFKSTDREIHIPAKSGAIIPVSNTGNYSTYWGDFSIVKHPDTSTYPKYAISFTTNENIPDKNYFTVRKYSLSPDFRYLAAIVKKYDYRSSVEALILYDILSRKMEKINIESFSAGFEKRLAGRDSFNDIEYFWTDYHNLILNVQAQYLDKPESSMNNKPYDLGWFEFNLQWPENLYVPYAYFNVN